MVSFSLVIPTYNERENIVPLMHRVSDALGRMTDSYEIIVVDDDSPDKTWQVSEVLATGNLHLRVIRREGERGLATAVLAGWNAASGEILGVMDGDLQHPPETLKELLETMQRTNADVVIASRKITGGSVGEWDLTRRLSSWLGTVMARLVLPGILGTVRDPMSGFFLLRRSVIQGIPLRPKGYKILIEVLTKGRYQNVVEVPYVFDERKEGESKFCLEPIIQFVLHLIRLSWDAGEVKRFLRFCIVGCSGIFVNEGALKLLTESIGLYYMYSSSVAVELAIISNFLLNEYWTFRDRSSQRPCFTRRFRRFLKFNVICALGAILNIVTLWVMTEFVGIHYLLSNLAGIGVASLWNFAMNSLITWKTHVAYRLETRA